MHLFINFEKSGCNVWFYYVVLKELESNLLSIDPSNSYITPLNDI